MKKYILSVFALLSVIFAGNAQDPVNEVEVVETTTVQQQYDPQYIDSLQQALFKVSNRLDEMDAKAESKKIWGRGRYTRLGYAIAQNAPEGSPVEKSKWSFFYSKGTSYRFPSKAIAGMVKVGFDVVWFDVMVSKYNSPYNDEDGGWTNPLPSSDNSGEFDLNIGRTTLNIGAFGIGPNVSVAPFVHCGKAARPLRVSAYFHFQPSVGAYIMSEAGETEASFAYCNMFDLGANISYRGIALGVEGRWGSGKFKPIEFGSGDGDNVEIGLGDKFTRKFATTRFYIQFAF